MDVIGSRLECMGEGLWCSWGRPDRWLGVREGGRVRLVSSIEFHVLALFGCI